MRELNKENLIEYLKHAIDLENGVITQQRIIEQYNSISTERKPSLQLEDMPTRKTINPRVKLKDDKNVEIIFYIFGGIFLGLGIFFLKGLEKGKDYYSALAIDWLMIITGGVMILYPFIKNRIEKKNDKTKQDQFNQQYEEAYQRATEINKEREENYGKNLSEWEISNTDALNSLTKPLNELQNTLSTYYSLDVIFPKYRNLPALTSIYEYLTSGRCDELTGPNGAYNLYESELRQNTIISQLSVIISNLEQIRQNQYTLYQEMVKMNASLQTIVGELEDIHSYTYTLTELTALNTYYTGIAASSASAMAFYNTIA